MKATVRLVSSLAVRMKSFQYILVVFLINTAIGQYEINENDDIQDIKGSLRLPKNLEPIYYKLELEPFFEPTFKFDGKVEIDFRCIKPTRRIVLHVKNLTIEIDNVKISCDQNTIVPNIENIREIEKKNFLVIELNSALKKEKVYKLTINYKGDLADDLNGFYRSSYNNSKGIKRWIATTQFEATDARKAFPCFDEPAMKAVFEVTIIIPKDMIALSNTEIAESVPSNDGTKVSVRFKPSVKMSTYLLVFIVCDFDYRETHTKRGIKVRVYAQKDLINDVNYSLHLAAKTIDFYENYFGVEFPLNKMDLIAIPDFSAGAMENWGLITYRETRILYNAKRMTTNLKQAITLTVTHELAHQWFGNLVTMEWWDDLWLNEGFATAMEYISANYSEPSWQMDNQFIAEETRDAQYADSFVNSHPVSAKVSDPDEIDELFDDISYSKGAALIRMMNFILGADTFRKGIKNYLQTLSYKNAIQDDLWHFLAEAAKSEGNDIDVAKTMNTWTLQMGYPVIDIKQDYERSKTYITQKYFHQHMGSKSPKDQPYLWEVPVTITTEADMQWDKPQIIWLHSSNDTTDGLLAEENQWIIGNTQLLGYYRVNYDLENWAMLTKQLNDDHTVVHLNNRGQILYDSFSLARAGLLDYKIAFDLTEYLLREQSYIPWTLALDSIQDVLKLFYGVCKDKPLRAYLTKLLLPSYEMVGWEEDIENEPHLKLLFRSLILNSACSFGYKDCISMAKNHFTFWKEDPENNTLKPNLKPIILCNGLKYGTSSDWDFVWNHYLKLQDPAEKNIMLQALSCSREKKILMKYLQMILDSPDIRRQDGTMVMNNIARNKKGFYLVWNFFKENWPKLKKRFAGSPWYLKGTLKTISSYFSSEEQLNELMSFYEEQKDNLGPVNRAFKQSIEQAQGNVLWMQRNEHVILDWLKTKMN